MAQMITRMRRRVYYLYHCLLFEGIFIFAYSHIITLSPAYAKASVGKARLTGRAGICIFPHFHISVVRGKIVIQ